MFLHPVLHLELARERETELLSAAKLRRFPSVGEARRGGVVPCRPRPVTSATARAVG
jgi:hypothetical protein